MQTPILTFAPFFYKATKFLSAQWRQILNLFMLPSTWLTQLSSFLALHHCHLHWKWSPSPQLPQSLNEKQKKEPPKTAPYQPDPAPVTTGKNGKFSRGDVLTDNLKMAWVVYVPHFPAPGLVSAWEVDKRGDRGKWEAALQYGKPSTGRLSNLLKKPE